MTWLQPLLGKWMEKLRGYHKIGETAAMPGAKLAALVTRHMRTVFAEHRRVLEDDYDYSIRRLRRSDGVDTLQEVDCRDMVTSVVYGESIGTTGCSQGW